MNAAAFVVLAAMLTAYVMLDGYDLGVGAVHLWFSKTERGRTASLAAIKPFWNGNEVFLIAAGAALFALFPKVYAAAFSGFYLPFIIVLWLLMIRGMSIELRGYFPSDIWNGFWDVAFSLASGLLALLFGVALGNIVRGVPLDPQGYFAGTFGFLLNGYALSVGGLALATLSMHGAAFLWMRVDQDLQPKAQALVRVLWPIVLLLFIGVTVETFAAHPIGERVALWISPSLALAALIVVAASKHPAGTLAASSIFLAALMASAAQTMFPYLLPAFTGGGLNIYNAAPNEYTVGTALTVTIIGGGAALCYGTVAALRMTRARSPGQ